MIEKSFLPEFKPGMFNLVLPNDGLDGDDDYDLEF